MKSKRFRGILAAVLAVAMAGVLAWPAVMSAQISQAGAYYYFFQVVNEADEPFTTEGAVRCSIYNRGSGDNAYIAYTSTALVHNTATGSYQLPLASNRNGLIHWYSALSTPVNVKCFTQYGDYAFKNGLSINTHKVRIDTSGAYKISRFPYVGSAALQAPQSTGIVIPSGGVITDLAIERVTALRGSPELHLNVGFAGNHTVATQNALASTVALETPGFLILHSQNFIVGAPGSTSGSHLGLALRHATAGGGSGVGTIFIPRNYMVHVNSGLEVTYNVGGPAATSGVGGHVYIFWRALHVGFNSQPLN